MALNVAVIGAGKWGENHVRVFSEIDCNLVGLADVNPEKKALARKYNLKFETNYKELLPLVDAVSVVVSTDLHYKVVKDCLMANKHVFVEKPITLDSKEAEELMNLAREKNRILSVGYIFRFNPVVQELKKELKNLGDTHYITARYVHSNKPPRKDCGVVFNFAIHLIDILNFVLDKKPKKVFCKKVNYLSEEREDCALLILDYGDFIANLEVSWFHPLKKRDMWIIKSKGKIYVDFLEQTMQVYPIRITHEKTIAEREINVEIRKCEPLKEELKHFCECVENNLLSNEVTNLGEEYITTKICEKCLESAKLGKEISL